MFTGELTWRELGVLIRGLPPTSRLRIALADGQQPWQAEHYLLAHLYDAVSHGNWQRAAAGAKKRPPYPKPFPKPGGKARAEDPKRAAARTDALRRARERQRAIDAGEIT